MNYMGSKAKVAKKLLPTILKNRKEGQWYVEPFVGGANMIDKVEGNRMGRDIHEHLIAFHQAMQGSWRPPQHLTKEQYYEIKETKDDGPSALVAFVGFVCSFGSKYWGGYAKNAKGRDYCKEGYRNCVKQAPNLKGVEFSCGSYDTMEIPPNSIIYCDPPYAGTTGYRNQFDSDRFYQWVRDMSKKGHEVFVSEYSAPADFECIQQIQVSSTMNKNEKQKKIEKLFKWSPARAHWLNDG